MHLFLLASLCISFFVPAHGIMQGAGIHVRHFAILGRPEHAIASSSDRQLAQNDTCGVRTHALSEWRLEPPP